MYFKGVYCIINVLFRLPRDGGRAVLVSEIVLWVALSVFTLKITSSNSLIPLSSLIKTAFFFYLILTKQIFTVLMIYLFFIYRCCGGLVVSQRGDTGPEFAWSVEFARFLSEYSGFLPQLRDLQSTAVGVGWFPVSTYWPCNALATCTLPFRPITARTDSPHPPMSDDHIWPYII